MHYSLGQAVQHCQFADFQGDNIKSPSDDYQKQMVYLSKYIFQKKEGSMQYIKMFLLDQNLPEMINLNTPQMRERIV